MFVSGCGGGEPEGATVRKTNGSKTDYLNTNSQADITSFGRIFQRKVIN